jgi:ATP-dependent Clp protease ATP-binding subunit ClpA
MNGYNFTERVRKVLQLARQEAITLRHEYVGTEHMLLGLCAEGDGVADAALMNLGVDTGAVREQILKTVKPGKDDGSDAARPRPVASLAPSPARWGSVDRTATCPTPAARRKCSSWR